MEKFRCSYKADAVGGGVVVNPTTTIEAETPEEAAMTFSELHPSAAPQISVCWGLTDCMLFDNPKRNHDILQEQEQEKEFQRLEEQRERGEFVNDQFVEEEVNLMVGAELDNEESLEGINGWLILVALGMIVGPCKILWQLKDYPEMFSSGVFQAFGSTYTALLLVEGVINFSLFCCFIALGYKFFTKRKNFPKWFIGLHVFVLGFEIINYFVVIRLLPLFASEFEKEIVPDIIHGIIISVIWIPYMLKSKRVKNTFVNTKLTPLRVYAGAAFVAVCVLLISGSFSSDLTVDVGSVREAAEQGQAVAQFNLGDMYTEGVGVAKDSAEAAKWYRKAAEQGHTEAQYMLALHYDLGWGIAENNKEAFKWYRKAAEKGIAGAQHMLGMAYHNGSGVAENDVEAVKWFRKAAEQGEAVAQLLLGSMYDNGEGVAEDDEEAVKWYRKAAEQGEAVAQYNLGVMYADGEGVAEDDVEAVKWYRKAADQGEADAIEALKELGVE